MFLPSNQIHLGIGSLVFISITGGRQVHIPTTIGSGAIERGNLGQKYLSQGTLRGTENGVSLLKRSPWLTDYQRSSMNSAPPCEVFYGHAMLATTQKPQRFISPNDIKI